MANWRTTLRGTVFGQEMAIVRYWRTTFTPTNFQPFADTWGEILEGTWDVAVHTDTILEDIYISQAETGSLGFSVTPANFPLVGTLTPTTGLPSHDAVLSIYTSGALTYPRQNRNRLAGANEGQIESGVLSAGGVITWEAVNQALSTAFSDGDETWLPLLWSDEYQAGNLVTGRAIRPRLSTQRSRRIGSGA